MGVAKNDPIIIIGGGAFGLSTALHLVDDGYTNITVFDKDDIPSRFSAANDLNKIVRAEYEDDFYTDLTLEAIAAWQQPPFASHFHQVGFLHCVSKDASSKAIDTLQRFQASAEGHADIAPSVVRIDGAKDIRSLVHQFQQSPVPGWTGYLNRLDGYAHSANALRAVHRTTQSQGVRFVLGHAGAVAEIVYATNDRNERQAVGIRTASGAFHDARVVIVTAGAECGRLVPSVGSQLVAKAWSIAHVQVTEREAQHLRGIPVTYARDLGFLFEPDPENRLIKLCPMGAGFINTHRGSGISYAPATLAESAFMPPEDERRVRTLLSHVLPALADRPLLKKSLCWFADTRDSEFIIDFVPHTAASVALVSGDSGHGFKMFPIVGRWVKELLENPQQQQTVPRWRWKGEPAASDAAGWGGDVSWRLGETQELADIQPRLSARL